jgi:hypothetical protein
MIRAYLPLVRQVNIVILHLVVRMKRHTDVRIVMRENSQTVTRPSHIAFPIRHNGFVVPVCNTLCRTIGAGSVVVVIGEISCRKDLVRIVCREQRVRSTHPTLTGEGDGLIEYPVMRAIAITVISAVLPCEGMSGRKYGDSRDRENH